jgi:hypothetical protein
MTRKLTLTGLLLFLLTGLFAPAAQAAAPQYVLDVRDEPVLLLASYYNAVARREYQRAYNYWEAYVAESAVYGKTVDQFAAGFAQTSDIAVYTRVPARTGAATGNLYTDVPVLIHATLTNGTQQYFIGCFTMHRANVPVGNATEPDPNWSLRQAVINTTNRLDLTMLNTACPINVGVSMDDGTNGGFEYDWTGSPISTLVSYFNAVVRREYSRAYGYWTTPPGNATLQQFTAGYANTADVWLYLKLDIRYEGAAGSQYIGIPVFLVGIQSSTGAGEYFAGCYSLRTSNVPVGNATTVTPNWRMYSYDIQPVAKMLIGLQEMTCG